MDSFLTFQEACGTVEPSAMRGYRYGFVPEPLEKNSQARLKACFYRGRTEVDAGRSEAIGSTAIVSWEPMQNLTMRPCFLRGTVAALSDPSSRARLGKLLPSQRFRVPNIQIRLPR